MIARNHWSIGKLRGGWTVRFAFIGTALLFLSGCEAGRDRQFAECQLKYAPDKVGTCMEAAGYRPVYGFCAAYKTTYTVRECWE
jgi:hypothetical protein